MSLHRLAVLIAASVLLLIGSLPAQADDGPPPPGGPPAAGGPAGCSSLSLVLFNPAPGDLLAPGQLVIQGKALDTSAPTAPGVDRVQLYFDHPRGENGASFMGEVDAGSTGGGQYLTASGFQVMATIPDTSAPNFTHVLYAYARSALSGQEQIISFPIQLRKPLSVGNLTPTPTPPAATVLSLRPCEATPTPSRPAFPTALVGASAGTTDSLTLSVFNPQTDDSLLRGMYEIQGLASDASASTGSGIDRVQAFLDPRDLGGQYLGTTTTGSTGAGGVFGFRLIAVLPSRSGPHTLSVYATSSVTGRETSVMIPITIE